MTDLRVARADLADPRVIALLGQHLEEARRNSPAGSVFALDLTGLADPAVSLYALWDGEALAGLGALKQLSCDHAEIKSMRTAATHQRRGIGRRMLDHLLSEARARGYGRVLLETGANDAFAPARAMYEAAGFVRCEAFGDYTLTDFNRCYALAL